eukprot:5910577-Pyramimonas_sp.AAC.1
MAEPSESRSQSTTRSATRSTSLSSAPRFFFVFRVPEPGVEALDLLLPVGGAHEEVALGAGGGVGHLQIDAPPLEGAGGLHRQVRHDVGELLHVEGAPKLDGKHPDGLRHRLLLPVLACE